MSYKFHDIKKIIEAYLDDLAAHSKMRVDHPTHLRAIFDRCRKYKTRLHPLKCSFCVITGKLLGFIISKHGIMVDPLKVEAILQLSPPCIYEAPFLKFPASKTLESGPNNSLFLSLVCDPGRLKGSLSSVCHSHAH